MKRKLLLVVALVAGMAVAWNVFFRTPEAYLKKQTKKLIKRMDNPAGETKNLVSVSSKVSKIAKYIHYDVILSLDYQGKLEKVQSLNEFRSFLSFYFTKVQGGKISYDELVVTISEPAESPEKAPRTATVSFKFSSTIEAQAISCDTRLEWVKEDKWFIKTIDIKNCS